MMQKLVIFMSGFPGSGKGTQGKTLGGKYNMEHLSTGELFRVEVASGSDLGKKMKTHMDGGTIIPPEIAFPYITQELKKPIYKKGIIFDGYPKDIDSLNFIIKLLHDLGFIPFMAIHFNLSRKEVESRLTGRLHCETCKCDYHITKNPPEKENICDKCDGPLNPRFDDTLETIRRRLDTFERDTGPVLEEFKKMGIYKELNAEQSISDVGKDLCNLIDDKMIEERSKPYFLKYHQIVEDDQTYHGHIDAECQGLLDSIIRDIEEIDEKFQNKIYPLYGLSLGRQTKSKEFQHLYRCLPNFHNFEDDISSVKYASYQLTKGEAFATSKMGSNGFNWKQIHATLMVCEKYPPNRGIMTELEEEIYTGHIKKGTQKVVITKSKQYVDDREEHFKSMGEKWKAKLISGIPIFEGHHGFDIPKVENKNEPPILLEDIVKLSEAIGFEVGGWFIFKKKDHWAYRSNEFTNEHIINAIETLEQQAKELNKLLYKMGYEVENGFSLEKVIAMWRF